jgi:hypothetical protein
MLCTKKFRSLYKNEFIHFAEEFNGKVERKMNSFRERKSVEGDGK